MEQSEQPLRIRPESIIARNFSEDLDSLFGLHTGSTIGNLSETVQEKKRTVSTQEQELAALESRLREAEERLARATGSSPTTQKNDPLDSSEKDDTQTRQQASAGAHNPSQTLPLRQASAEMQPPVKLPDYQQAAPASRPPNPRTDSSMPRVPGAMPRTPTPRFDAASDYVTVDRTR